jgi:hypothetical protein
MEQYRWGWSKSFGTTKWPYPFWTLVVLLTHRKGDEHEKIKFICQKNTNRSAQAE